MPTGWAGCAWARGGSAEVVHDEHGVRWIHTPDEVHVSTAVATWPLFLARYELVGACPHDPDVLHARHRANVDPL